MSTRQLGPMHDQAGEIRLIASNTAPVNAIAGWKVVAVPNGVRVTTCSSVHFDRLSKALAQDGYKTVSMRPVGVRSAKRFSLVVVDWDGEHIREMLLSLRHRVRVLNDELSNCPARTVELYEHYRMFEGHDRHTAVDLTFEQLEEERRRTDDDQPATIANRV